MRFSTDSRTICGAGAFACQLVMFYRRKLPHWHPDLTEGTFLFVTWRLAGSIPQARLPRPPRSAPISAGRAFVILDREVDKAASGPVWLRDARVASGGRCSPVRRQRKTPLSALSLGDYAQPRSYTAAA